MAFSSKDIEKFCSIDGGWQTRPGSNHIIATKYLDDGTRLQVQICHDKTKQFTPGACNRICKQSLALPGGEAQFKEVLRTGVAPERRMVTTEMTSSDDLTAATADQLIYECKIGQHQASKLTEPQARKVVSAQRFGVNVGKMSPEHLQCAVSVVTSYGVEDDLAVFEVFEAAGSGFGAQEIAELMSLKAPSRAPVLSGMDAQAALGR